MHTYAYTCRGSSSSGTGGTRNDPDWRIWMLRRLKLNWTCSSIRIMCTWFMYSWGPWCNVAETGVRRMERENPSCQTSAYCTVHCSVMLLGINLKSWNQQFQNFKLPVETIQFLIELQVHVDSRSTLQMAWHCSWISLFALCMPNGDSLSSIKDPWSDPGSMHRQTSSRSAARSEI